MSILRREMVEAPDGGYYQVSVHSEDGVTGWAHIPDMGRRQVRKILPKYSYQAVSFAWHIRQERKSSEGE
jgi:hypothetical protein